MKSLLLLLLLLPGCVLNAVAANELHLSSTAVTAPDNASLSLVVETDEPIVAIRLTYISSLMFRQIQEVGSVLGSERGGTIQFEIHPPISGYKHIANLIWVTGELGTQHVSLLGAQGRREDGTWMSLAPAFATVNVQGLE